MRIRPLFFFLLIITISSCEKYINISIPEETNKPVLNMLMNKDSVMIARVSFSGRLNGSIPEAGNAVVNLYENGVFKETLTPYVFQNSTYYRSNTLPEAGAKYRVTAAIPGYTEVSGSDQIPDTVETGELKMTFKQLSDWESDASVTVQLHDDPTAQNYYRIRLYQVYEWKDSSGNGGRTKTLLSSEGDESDLDLFDDNYHPEFYTTDALFNGRSPRFIFRIHPYGNFEKILVEITSLTYSSYNYLNSSYMARQKNDDPLSEKVIIYNNITNGLGIIGGVAQREYDLMKP